MATRTLASLTSAERIRFEGRLEKAEAALEAIDIVRSTSAGGNARRSWSSVRCAPCDEGWDRWWVRSSSSPARAA
jgi:hypothetical protein